MSYKIVSKYIKEINFNIPSAKAFFLLSKDISNYKINIDIKSSQIKEKVIDVQIALGLSTPKEDLEKINTNIVFSAIIEFEKEVNNKEEMEKVILIEIPTKVYPELRKIFIFIFESSGFKDIKISENVDFQKLYMIRKTQ